METDERVQAEAGRDDEEVMRIPGGMFMLLVAAMIGIVEYRVIVDPSTAHDVTKFAEHDPFPRLPWDIHVIFVLLCLLFFGLDGI